MLEPAAQASTGSSAHLSCVLASSTGMFLHCQEKAKFIKSRFLYPLNFFKVDLELKIRQTVAHSRVKSVCPAHYILSQFSRDG